MIDQDTLTTVRMMAMNGLKTSAIAEALGMSELLVRRYLRQPPKSQPPPEAA